MPLSLVATCALGLEEILAGELRAAGARDVAPQRGAVAFRGGWSDAWRANWRLRTANRVLVALGEWEAGDGDALAAGAGALVGGNRSWDGVRAGDLFHPRRSFAVRATSARSRLRDTRWLALRLKDGLVDAQRRRWGRRADVDRSEPDLPLRVWLSNDRATLLLDTSGTSLDHRGYRLERTVAPLREHLAAACVLASGWDGRGPVVDPMCGSGTLLAEAGAWALGLAPGRARRGWAFEGFPGFDRAAWLAIRAEPLAAPGPDVALFGVDRSREAIAAAGANLERAGLEGRATLAAGDAFDFVPPPGPGLLLVNPAYGERLSAEPDQWPRLGDLLKQRYAGWRAAVVAGGRDRGKHLGLRPRRRLPVRNGPLEVRLLLLDLY